ncbi:MAG: hypothetical protein HY718_01290, partial [Planctomycetes bacterium]|nr:hypothetical protein [Planctomycetota bacterium]
MTNPVPFWSVDGACSPANIFQDGNKGDNGSPCLRNILPVGVGTRMIKDLSPGAGSSTFGGSAAMTGVDAVWRLWLSADDGTDGQELYRLQATLYPVLTLHSDLNAGAASSGPQGLFRHSPGALGSAYFSADDGTNGRELWKVSTSTGLTDNVTFVADINPGPGSSNPSGFQAGNAPGGGVPAIVIFAADDGTNGREIWKVDTNGALMIQDINPTAGVSSDPQSLTTVVLVANTDIRVFFTADDGVNGRELWATDGTPEGTLLFQDLHPGPDGSSPERLTAAPGRLFFLADDGAHGVELWVLPVPAAEPFRRGDSNADGAVDISDAVAVIGFLFLAGAEPTCLDAADAEDSGVVDISDAISLLSYLFLDAPPP